MISAAAISSVLIFMCKKVFFYFYAAQKPAMYISDKAVKCDSKILFKPVNIFSYLSEKFHVSEGHVSAYENAV